MENKGDRLQGPAEAKPTSSWFPHLGRPIHKVLSPKGPVFLIGQGTCLGPHSQQVRPVEDNFLLAEVEAPTPNGQAGC